MNGSTRSLRLVLTLLMILASGHSMANIPPGITSFQGVLRDASEVPLSGTYPIVFRYWSDAVSLDAAAHEIGWESHPAVAVSDGLFTVLLGAEPFQNGASGYGGLNINQMFGDFQQVWLQLEVDGDVLLPRIQFAAAPWAFNCTQLQDRSPGEFLRSEGSDNFTGSDLYGYTLTFDPPTTLDVAGTFRLAGATVTSSADELNRLDGAGATVTPGSLTALTDGSVADGLHSHTNTNAATLDGLDGAEFLRSDASDSYTSGTLTFAAGTTLDAQGTVNLNGTLNMNPDGPDQNQSIVFFEDGGAGNQSILWDDAADRFSMTSGLNLQGPIRVTGSTTGYNGLGQGTPSSGVVTDSSDLYVAAQVEFDSTLFLNGALFMDDDGPDGFQSIYFYDGGNRQSQHLRWNDASDLFELSNNLFITGSLNVLNLGDAPRGYNSFGNGTPEAAGVNGFADVYVTDVLEVDGSAYVGGSIYADGVLFMKELGVDQDQVIWFFEDASMQGEQLRWSDGEDRFELSDELALVGPLLVGSTGVASVAYNRFGTGSLPISAAITNASDVMIDDDIEIGSNAYVNGNLEVNGIIDVLNVHGPAATVLNLEADNNVRVMIDDDNSGTVNLAEWFHDASIASTSKLAELQEDGDFRIRGALSQNVAFDLAESFWASEPIAAGEIVAADPARPGAVLRATGETASLVLGIASARPGVLLGSAPFDESALGKTWGEAAREQFGVERESLVAEIASRHPELQAGEADDARIDSLALEPFFERHVVAVALAGRVRVRADASRGPIAVGDPLGPGPVGGTAARAADGDPTVAIALEPLAHGRGDVLAFVYRGGVSAAKPAASTATVASTEQVVVESPAEIRVDAASVSHIEPSIERKAIPASPTASFPAIGSVEVGDLVRIDDDVPGSVRVTDTALDARVVGIVTAVDPGASTVSVALGGVVTCKVDASNGPVEPGDLLTSSSEPGHATRATVPLPGTIVGKALAAHATGSATIQVLVVLR